MPVDMEKLYTNTVNTACRDHIMNMEKGIEDTLKLNIEIEKIIYERTLIHKMSMVREFLFKSMHAITREFQFRNFIRDFTSSRPYVDECIEGMVRSVQNKIYNLYDTFNNDAFRDEYMFENKGHALESYYDRESEVNIWRSVVDDKVEELFAEFMREMEHLKLRAKKMKREEFILSHFYSEFYSESTKKEAKHESEESQSTDTKKRKSLD
jgi:hypothetical protein